MMQDTLLASDTESLEQWLEPPTHALSVDDLRAFVEESLDSAMKSMQHDFDMLGTLMQKKAAVQNARSREELVDVNRWISEVVFVSPKEMSREELEGAALAWVDQVPRKDLEEELFQMHAGLSLEELHEELMEGLQELSQEELDQHGQAAIRNARLPQLVPVIRQITMLLSEQELLQLFSASGQVAATLLPPPPSGQARRPQSHMEM